jgi:predicted transcriptional regulator
VEDFIKNLELIGLRKREIKVLTTLHIFGPLSVTQLGLRSKLSRTTVDAIVRRLHERGLVRRVPKGKRHLWKATNVDKVKNRTDTAFDAIQKQIDPGFVGPVLESIDARDIGIRVFRGKKQIWAANYQYFESDDKRIRVIQGRGFIKSFMNSLFERDYELTLHEKLRREDTIVELVTHEDALQDLDAAFRGDHSYLKKVFETAMIYSVVPRGHVPFNAEVLILHDQVRILMPSEVLLVVIKHAHIVALYRAYFELLKGHAKQVNTHDLLRQMLEQGGE